MTRVGLRLLVILCTLMGMSCAETLDVPAAPEVDAVAAAYANPTAEISSAIMAAVGDELLELREQIEESEVLAQFLEVILSVQVELDQNTDDNGNLVVPGLGSFQDPNAVIEINHNCPGWDPNAAGSTAETSGSVRLNMLLELGNIHPVVWGEATDCQFLATAGDGARRSSYDGEVAVQFGDELVPTDESLTDLLATFVLEGSLIVEGRDLPVRRSFRLDGRGDLEILWELSNGNSFVYFFNREPQAQGIRDANGTFACSLEERQCSLPSGSFSW